MAPSVRFGVIGLNHNHIYGITEMLEQAGAELVAYYAAEADLAADFSRRFPAARRAREAAEVLEDERIALIASAAIPDDRVRVGVAALRHGKDFVSDKPAFTTLAALEQAKRVQSETGRIYGIYYGERVGNAATVRAGELIGDGAIGTPFQTVGLGPHRLNAAQRPSWFWDPTRSGGIITDIGSHQTDQFLYFTASSDGEAVAAEVANIAHPNYPDFDDLGEVMLRGEGGSGYFRVDWFTPDGLDTWGDGRLTILGTDGYIEVRKYVDIAGRPGPGHLFLVNHRVTEHVDCSHVELPYGRQLLADIRDRTETAMSQAHAFRATELALRAQAAAQRRVAEALSRPRS
jgi:predicted dehydrogenase